MNILHLISSPRGAESFSIKLGNEVLERLQQAHPTSVVTTKDLTQTPFPHLEEVHLQSFYTPAEDRTPELIEAVKHSDAAIAELRAADIIVIGVPFYNFNVPSTLKAWIDHIARVNETFRYDENGPEGLIKNKKVYLVVASGGVYSEGPMKAYDFGEPYLRAVLGFMGMKDITTFRVEGVNIPGLKETALENAIKNINL